MSASDGDYKGGGPGFPSCGRGAQAAEAQTDGHRQAAAGALPWSTW